MNQILALARRLSWLENRPIHQKAAGLTPSRGARGRPPTDVSLSLKAINILGKKERKTKKDWLSKFF